MTLTYDSVTEYHYITVPGHPSDNNPFKTIAAGYHYITVPGHPSDGTGNRFKNHFGVPLHYSSGASIRLVYGLLPMPVGTITLQFRGIHPTELTGALGDTRYHYITVPGHPSDIVLALYG